MLGKVDVGILAADCVIQQVVELRPAAAHLQPVDAPVASVVGHDDGEGDAHHRRRRHLGIRHHVGAVAGETDHIALGLRHLDAHGPGDLVAHAGKAIFHVVGPWPPGLPELVQLARHGARRAHGDGVFVRRTLDGSDDLHVGRQGVAVLIAYRFAT